MVRTVECIMIITFNYVCTSPCSAWIRLWSLEASLRRHFLSGHRKPSPKLSRPIEIN